MEFYISSSNLFDIISFAFSFNKELFGGDIYFQINMSTESSTHAKAWTSKGVSISYLNSSKSLPSQMFFRDDNTCSSVIF